MAAKSVSKVEVLREDGSVAVAAGQEVTPDEAKALDLKPSDLIPADKVVDEVANQPLPSDSGPVRTAKVAAPGRSVKLPNDPPTLEEETQAPRRDRELSGVVVVVAEKIATREDGTQYVAYARGQEVRADEAKDAGLEVVGLNEVEREFANQARPQDTQRERNAKVHATAPDATVPTDPPSLDDETLAGSKEAARKAPKKPVGIKSQADAEKRAPKVDAPPKAPADAPPPDTDASPNVDAPPAPGPAEASAPKAKETK